MGRNSVARTTREDRIPDLKEFADFEDFVKWYENLKPTEPVNLHEAATIYFNYLEIYNF